MTKRVDKIHSSGIRKVFAKATEISGVISLGIGQPDFPIPAKIKEKLINSIEEDRTGYTLSAGIPKLREKIIEKYPYKFAEDVIVTSGVTGGLFLVYSALLEEGDELIVFDPYFSIYPDLCEFLGAKAVLVKTNPDFSINTENLRKAISKKTKAIIINSPNNPTGYVYSKEELEDVVTIARENNLWIISDEVYSDFDYDNKFATLGSLYDKTIVLNGFSKNFALTGFRIGYAVGPKKIIEDMTKLQQYTYVCAPSAAQHALAEDINYNTKENIEKFRKRRNLVYEKLKDCFDFKMPSGAFYAFIKLPEEITGEEFFEECLKKKLLVIPGNAFSKTDDCFRISYAVSEEDLKKGLDILCEVAREMRGQYRRNS